MKPDIQPWFRQCRHSRSVRPMTCRSYKPTVAAERKTARRRRTLYAARLLDRNFLKVCRLVDSISRRCNWAVSMWRSISDRSRPSRRSTCSSSCACRMNSFTAWWADMDRNTIRDAQNLKLGVCRVDLAASSVRIGLHRCRCTNSTI